MTTQPSPRHVVPGTILLGKYQVDRVLGEGGMGMVVAATHLQLREQVALKFLLPEVMSNHEVVQRFLREAQAAVRLKGEHVARVIDVGELPDGVPYMVMEYLDGGDLAGVLAQRGALPPGEAIDYLLQACEALAEAHALGIVHRDVKPANFFVTRRPGGSPLLKVLDFGISKAPVEIDSGLTRTKAVMGTPSYMAPEQMRSARDADARADIWALGVVLYECLAGWRPFEAETFSALCLKAAMDPAPPLPASVPAPLREVVARCLEKDAAARYQSVAELAAALAPFAADARAASVSVDRCRAMLPGPRAPNAQTMRAGPTTPTTLGGSAAEVAATSGARTRRRAIAGVLVAVGVAAAVALMVVLGARGSSTSGAAASEEPEEIEDAAAGAVPDAPSPAAVEAATVDAGVAVASEAPDPVDAAPAIAPDRAASGEDADEDTRPARRSPRNKRHERRDRRPSKPPPKKPTSDPLDSRT